MRMTRVSNPGGDLLPNPPVLWLSELSAAERLVLRTARQLDAGDPCPGLVAAEFHRAWNGIAAAWDAFLAVYGLVDVLTVRGRRPFRLRAAACPRITADERLPPGPDRGLSSGP